MFAKPHHHAGKNQVAVTSGHRNQADPPLDARVRPGTTLVRDAESREIGWWCHHFRDVVTVTQRATSPTTRNCSYFVHGAWVRACPVARGSLFYPYRSWRVFVHTKRASPYTTHWQPALTALLYLDMGSMAPNLYLNSTGDFFVRLLYPQCRLP